MAPKKVSQSQYIAPLMEKEAIFSQPTPRNTPARSAPVAPVVPVVPTLDLSKIPVLTADVNTTSSRTKEQAGAVASGAKTPRYQESELKDSSIVTTDADLLDLFKRLMKEAGDAFVSSKQFMSVLACIQTVTQAPIVQSTIEANKYSVERCRAIQGLWDHALNVMKDSLRLPVGSKMRGSSIQLARELFVGNFGKAIYHLSRLHSLEAVSLYTDIFLGCYEQFQQLSKQLESNHVVSAQAALQSEQASVETGITEGEEKKDSCPSSCPSVLSVWMVLCLLCAFAVYVEVCAWVFGKEVSYVCVLEDVLSLCVGLLFLIGKSVVYMSGLVVRVGSYIIKLVW